MYLIPKQLCANCKRLIGWNRCVEKCWPQYFKVNGPTECGYFDEKHIRHGVPQ